MKNTVTTWIRKAFSVLTLLSLSVPIFATNTVYVTVQNASFEDTQLEVENAIIEKGFVIDFNGDLAGMLENTANVAEDATPVFSNAEFWQFCSSAITRKFVKSNPMNIAYCPFVIFAYETMDSPGTVTIGFEPLPEATSKETNDLVIEMNTLLESIVVNAGQ